jgi:hypothetical protein
MAAAAAIATIGPTVSRQFIPPKVFDACPAMTATAKYTYLVNKIAFFQTLFF